MMGNAQQARIPSTWGSGVTQCPPPFSVLFSRVSRLDTWTDADGTPHLIRFGFCSSSSSVVLGQSPRTNGTTGPEQAAQKHPTFCEMHLDGWTGTFSTPTRPPFLPLLHFFYPAGGSLPTSLARRIWTASSLLILGFFFSLPLLLSSLRPSPKLHTHTRLDSQWL
ncbi:hypothetical protein B0H65DRAFT_258355 [Neurospora tetraspora]|uniref:Uncharacterized protein n=1 Tax=Neurospora tetraspora TaxID=94610 RepID=A0AAE0MPA1_9PEZI|nr:hypothetical protein B0H65DRAFT_258355 [Neurospora tetraspora]